MSADRAGIDIVALTEEEKKPCEANGLSPGDPPKVTALVLGSAFALCADRFDDLVERAVVVETRFNIAPGT